MAQANIDLTNKRNEFNAYVKTYKDNSTKIKQHEQLAAESKNIINNYTQQVASLKNKLDKNANELNKATTYIEKLTKKALSDQETAKARAIIDKEVNNTTLAELGKAKTIIQDQYTSIVKLTDKIKNLEQYTSNVSIQEAMDKHNELTTIIEEKEANILQLNVTIQEQKESII